MERKGIMRLQGQGHRVPHKGQHKGFAHSEAVDGDSQIEAKIYLRPWVYI